MSAWDNLIGRFEKHQDDRTKMDLDRFLSKYLVLFNRSSSDLDQDEAASLLKEYRVEIDPHKPLSIIENLDGVGEENLVLRLPPIETEVPTMNVCYTDSSIIDTLCNKLEQYTANRTTGVGNVIVNIADHVATTAIDKLTEVDEYSEVMDELEVLIDSSDSSESTPVKEGDIEWE